MSWSTIKVPGVTPDPTFTVPPSQTLSTAELVPLWMLAVAPLEIVSVPDGIVFPILSAMSVFVTRGRAGWALRPVDLFDEQELIDVAAQVYVEIADHNPQTMGKSKACYSALQRITAIYARLAA